MNVRTSINEYIESLSEPKRTDVGFLHKHLLQLLPKCKLWFLDGRDEKGRIVSNPNIGYGTQTIQYANGKSREFYQVGLSANTSGISVYIMGVKDKKYLPATYGRTIGKASVTGYCIKFKSLKDINIDVLDSAITNGVEMTK